MGNYISEQLAMFLRSIALGAALGLIYDLLGTLRTLGGKLWGTLLDALYCLAAACSLFFFMLAGSGELRLFILVGALGGAVLFFCLLSRPLRPLWALWLKIFLAPVKLAGGLLKKCGQFFKKLFSFARTWGTMVSTQWRGRRLPAPPEGDEAMGKTPEKSSKKQAKQKKRPNSKLTAAILLALLIGISVQILNLLGQLQSARAEETLCAARLAELESANRKLAEDIANRDSLDLIEDIARDELGLAGEGEKVFIYSK